MKNYYEILEVNENASPEVIEKAYKALAKKYHPDSWPRDKIFFAESKFKEITEAYEILSNENLRRDYDYKLGVNDSLNEKYNTLYFEHQQLKQEINDMKAKDELNNSINTTQDVNRFIKPNVSVFRDYFSSIKSVIKDEKLKPQDERSRDFKALLLTIVIISALVFIAWKVPAIHNYLFP